MRLIKMFGLAAIAAVAAMAFMGASSAMAQSTALCKSNEGGALTCAAGNVYTGHVEAIAKDPQLLTSVGTVLCEKSHVLGNALGLANPLVGHLELVSFTGNCNLGGTVPCEVETTELGLLKLLKTGPNVGLVTSEGTWVKVRCGMVLHCEFGGTFHAGTATGSAASLGTVKAVATPVQRRQVLVPDLCPATAELHALYTVQLPHALFIKT